MVFWHTERPKQEWHKSQMFTGENRKADAEAFVIANLKDTADSSLLLPMIKAYSVFVDGV